MRNYLVMALLGSLIIVGCGKNNSTIKLKQGTPAYELAENLASKLPYLDPKKNNPLISTKDFVVTTGEVIQVIYNNAGNRASQLKDMDTSRVKGILMQNAQHLADQRLVLNEAQKEGFRISDATVDSVMELQYQYSGGKEKFLEMLKTNGIDIQVVETGIRDMTIFGEFLDKTLAKAILPSEEELQQAYAEYTSKDIATVQHILLLTQGKSDAEKQQIRQKMVDILAQAKAGADFSELAKTYSEDPGSKDKGGLYENFGRGVMVKPFEDAAFSVPIGEISDVVETQYGYHILKVLARNNFKTFDEYRPELEKQLSNKHKPQAYQDYMAKLKEAQAYKVINF